VYVCVFFVVVVVVIVVVVVVEICIRCHALISVYSVCRKQMGHNHYGFTSHVQYMHCVRAHQGTVTREIV
jgi:hypothetical protein